MLTLTDPERQLLERLAAEGKATRLYDEDVKVAKSLEGVGLLFLIGEHEPYAVITPKGRRLLAELERKPSKPPKPPLKHSRVAGLDWEGEGASIRPEGDRLYRRGALWQCPDWNEGCTQSKQR